MQTAAIPQVDPVSSVLEEATEILDQVSSYSTLISDSLYLIVGGMLVVFLLYKLTSKFLFPYVKNRRLIRVIFGTLYVLILVVTMLLVAEKIGFELGGLGKIAILVVLLGAVLVFFLVPFLPRLPFIIGQMIEVNGVMGTVDAISTVHTTIRTFDGAIVFLPNPLVLASRITNFSDMPMRRIGLNITITLDTDFKKVQSILLNIMTEDERVLTEPAAPLVRISSADAAGVKLTAHCWTKNEDFLATQSELWLEVVNAFTADDSISMALPRQDIHISRADE